MRGHMTECTRINLMPFASVLAVTGIASQFAPTLRPAWNCFMPVLLLFMAWALRAQSKQIDRLLQAQDGQSDAQLGAAADAPQRARG